MKRVVWVFLAGLALATAAAGGYALMQAVGRETAFAPAVDLHEVERPAAWLGATRLATLSGTRLSLRALDDFQNARKLHGPDKVSGADAFTGGCFSEGTWTLLTARRKVSGSSVSTKALNAGLRVTMRDGRILDARAVPGVAGHVNPIDCGADASHAEKTALFGPHIRKGEYFGATGSVFATRHASVSTAVYRGDGGVAVYSRRNGEIGSLDLSVAPERRVTALRASYDAAREVYLLYAPTDDFFDAAAWPRAAWRVSSDLKLLESVSLPAGPWVRPATFLKRLSCFSCGCRCYTRMRVLARGGEVFIEISGRAAWPGTRGVYRLDQKAGAWRRELAAHLIAPVAISKDGCRIAFTDGALGVVDRCAGRRWRARRD